MTDALFLAPLGGAALGDVVLVDGDEGRHAVAVRRIKPGESVYVADGDGNAVHGEVLTADKAGLRVRCDELLRDEPAGPHWVLVQALAKGGRDEQAVEAVTELGIDEVVPWAASRSIVRWEVGPRGDRQLDRWRTTVRAAAKQSRRFAVPVVTPVLTSKELARDVVAHATVFVLHESALEPLAAQDVPREGRVALVVGPEGGITPEELALFADAGAKVVRVGRHVLRSSTAGLVALAQLQALATLLDLPRTPEPASEATGLRFPERASEASGLRFPEPASEASGLRFPERASEASESKGPERASEPRGGA